MLKTIQKIAQYLLKIITIYSSIAFVFICNASPPPLILHGNLPGQASSDNIKEDFFLTTMLPNLISWFLGFLASASIVVIMIGGYMHLTAFG